MGLDRVLAHKKFSRDLAVAHALRYQFEYLKLPSRDAQVLSLSLVWDEPFAARDRHFLHNHLPSLRPNQIPRTAKIAATSPPYISIECSTTRKRYSVSFRTTMRTPPHAP